MNKSELANRINQPTEKIDAILKDAGLPTDVEQYSPEQIGSLEAIAKMVETKQAKNFKDAGGLYRKIQNEAQLKEIAARYVMGDRIPELISALKLKPESIAVEQFEQFRMVCEQVQQGMELPMVAQGVLNKAQAKPAVSGGKAQSGPGSANQAVGTALAPRIMPGLITQGNASIEGIPLDLEGSMTHLWDETLGQRVDQDAAAIVKAPFDAINDASESIAPDKLYENYRGRYFRDMKVKLDSPEMIAYAKNLAKGKKSST
jgi:hypothetical protein